VAAWLKSVDDADLAIIVLTVREIAKGIAKLRKTKPETAAALDAVVSAIFDAFEGRILPVDRPVAAAWGEALGESDKHVDDRGRDQCDIFGVCFRELHDSDGAVRLNFSAYWREANSNPSLRLFLALLRELYLSAGPSS